LISVQLFPKYLSKNTEVALKVRCRQNLVTSVVQRNTYTVVVWHSGSTLVSINQVNLHRAQLVLRWVTVSGFSSRCRTFIYFGM